MKSKNEYFCPIINKTVRIEKDYSDKKKVSFEPEKSSTICIGEKGICNRNCSGCNLF